MFKLYTYVAYSNSNNNMSHVLIINIYSASNNGANFYLESFLFTLRHH